MIKNKDVSSEIHKLEKLALDAQVANDLDAAMRFYQEAVELDPSSALCYMHMATISLLQGNYHGAMVCDQIALELSPDVAEVHNHIGLVYQKMGELNKATYHFERALEINPKDNFTLSNLASVRKDDLQSAEQLYYRAAKKIIDKRHDFNKYKIEDIVADEIEVSAFVNYLNVIGQIGQWRKIADFKPLLLNIIKYQIEKDIQPSLDPLFAQILFQDQELIQQISRIYAHVACIDPGKKFTEFKSPEDKINIGYIYNSFNSYIYDSSLRALVDKHDKKKFNVFIFQTKYIEQASIYSNFKNAEVIQVSSLSFYAIANKINEYKIDILLDTTGYGINSKLPVLAFRPALAQINFLGNYNTMGAPYVNFLISDEVLIPEENYQYFQESIIQMPQNMAFIMPPYRKNLIRSDYGIPSNKFVLANFSEPLLLEEMTFKVFMDILVNVPETVLVLREDSLDFKHELMQRIDSYGVNVSRIHFIKVDKNKMEALHQLSDLYLDSLVVNSDVDVVTALSLNVPVLAMSSQHTVGRIAHSILASANLTMLVTYNVDEYKNLAIKLVKDANFYKTVKNKCNQIKDTDLFNQNKYLEKYEMGLNKSLAHWCDSLIKNAATEKQIDI